jgi:putative DNA primase/helicase
MKVEYIKTQAAGQWSGILQSLSPKLQEIIARGRHHGPCPMCSGKDRARCHNDFEKTGGIICNQCKGGADGFAVLMWANGWRFRKTRDAVARYLGLNSGTIPALRPQVQTALPKDWTRERNQLERIWSESQSGERRLIQYFQYRGLSIMPSDTLRLHPSLEYWHDGKSFGKFSCMIARIEIDGELVGLHRTYLDSDSFGKAPVPCAKKTIKCADSMSGGAIRLFEPEPNKPLVLCEGIETGLAIHDYSGWPIWPCGSRILLEKVILPDDVRVVYVAGDKDRSGGGQESAEKLAQRLANEGREVHITYPPLEIPEASSSVDWLDGLKDKEIAHV